jgi:Cu/Ag efflux protein CusF
VNERLTNKLEEERRKIHMKKRIVLPMAVLLMLSCTGLSLAQPTTTEQPGDSKAVKMVPAEMPKTTNLHHLAGEVVAVDPTAKTVTIKHMLRGQPKDATFNVAEKAGASLATLQPNDRVKLTYSKEHGRLMAQSIVEPYHKASK